MFFLTINEAPAKSGAEVELFIVGSVNAELF